jgi:Flp pilus assembly protein TadG
MRRLPLFRRLAENQRGAAAIEFALTVSIFFMLTLGIIEIGRYVAAQQSLLSAVHLGGRYAVAHSSSSSSPATQSSIQTVIQNAAGALVASSITATTTFSPNNNAGSTVTISATYPWTSLVPLLNLPSATITVTATMTIL